MQADFLDAHMRHWDDAERLFVAERWANSDHLYGVSAECGLKQLMLAFGMPFDSGRDRPHSEQDRKHVDSLWARYESYRHGHHQGAGYVLVGANAFEDWHVSQRYAHQLRFDANRAASHRDGADLVRQLIKKAQREGLI